MTDITARFGPDVLETLATALSTCTPSQLAVAPLIRLAAAGSGSPLAPSARTALREAFAPHGRTEELEAALMTRAPEDGPPRDQITPTSVDTFAEYVDSSTGYYVKPNSLFLDACREQSDAFLSPANVVDLGSGTGRNGLAAALLGAAVTFVDNSAAGSLFVQQQAVELGISSARVEVQDVREWSPAAHSIDTVCAITILEHIDRESRRDLAKTIASALKPGGLVVAKGFLDDDPGATHASTASETAGHVVSYFSYGEMVGLFPGFEIVRSREYQWLDRSHGPEHMHSAAELVARAPA